MGRCFLSCFIRCNGDYFMDRVHIIYGKDHLVSRWVGLKLGIPNDYKGYAAIGGVIDGKLIGGIVFHSYTNFSMEIDFYTTDARWCNRKTLKIVFNYIFNVCGCERIQAKCLKKNKKVRTLIERLGFKFEGTMRRGYDGKKDALMYSLLKDECRYLS